MLRYIGVLLKQCCWAFCVTGEWSVFVAAPASPVQLLISVSLLILHQTPISHGQR